MIYLIDDSELGHIDTGYLTQGAYSHCLCVIRNEAQLECQYDNLDTADCIMVHRSFGNSSIVYQKLDMLASERKEPVPFVAFSAGDSEEAVYNEAIDELTIYGLKKAVFYERLRPFLDDFMVNGTVNLKILAYGVDYQKRLVNTWARTLLHAILGKTGTIELEDLAALTTCTTSQGQPAFKRLMDVSRIDYDTLLENLEDEPITFEHFRTNIHHIINSFNQYGRNIYTWK